MSEKTKQGEEKSKDNKKLLIVIIILLAVIIIGGAIVLAFLLGKKSSQSSGDQVEDETPRQVVSSVRQVLDEESTTNVYEEMRQEVEEGMFECNMSFNWTFADGNSESKDAYVLNSENNTHPIYFDLLIQDTDELIYSSPVIPVGAELTDIKLDTSIPAGSYKCVCMYYLLKDIETQEVISSAGFVVNVEVIK